MRYLFASLLQHGCQDVEVEPHLQTLTGQILSSSRNSSHEARLDVSAQGFWQGGQRSFFDGGFNPFAKSHLSQRVATAISSIENEKKRHYNQRIIERIIEVEHCSFIPLEFTPYGGSGKKAECPLAELTHKVSEKKYMSYSTVSGWLRAKLSLNLLRSAVLCIRGSRAPRQESNVDVTKAIMSEPTGKIT